jgi:hypothetical protein
MSEYLLSKIILAPHAPGVECNFFLVVPNLPGLVLQSLAEYAFPTMAAMVIAIQVP